MWHKKPLLLLLLIFSIYLIFRVGWQDTIEFGYDQPRLATVIQDYLHKGTFLTAQEYSLSSPWGNFSWGPVLIWLNTPFILFSANPLSASVLISVFNSLSIIFIFILGYKYFSLKVGVVSSLFLALHPWWIIFSRMVYQPTILPTVISFSMLLTFWVLDKKNNNKGVLSVLMFSWGIILQMYLLGISFVFTSFFAVAKNVKTKHKKYILLGTLITFIIFIPSINYYANHKEQFAKFFTSQSNFEEKKVPIFTYVADLTKHFVLTISGSDFEFQLGYGYNQFLISNFKFLINFFINFNKIFILISILYGVKKKEWLLVGWCIAPFWFLIIFRAGILPRYFLMALPPLSLVFAIFVSDMTKKARWVIIFPLSIFLFWVFLMVSYFNFIETYSYPHGYLSHYSDISYSFLDQSMKYINQDAISRGGNFTISNDNTMQTQNSWNWATMYYINNVAKIKPNDHAGLHYLLLYSDENSPAGGSGGGARLAQFGPYVVYLYK